MALELGSLVSVPESVIWNSWVFLKVDFLLDRLHGKVSTLDHLERKGWSLANKCFLCHLKKEFIDHILIHYIYQDKDFMAFIVFPIFRVLGVTLLG